MSKRKTMTMILTVTVPAEMSAAHARLEVRTLINEQCNYSAESGDVKVRQLRPARKPKTTPRPLRRWDSTKGRYVPAEIGRL